MASASSSGPGSPLTPTAPTRRLAGQVATPPMKNEYDGSKLASSVGGRPDRVGEREPWSAGRCAQRCTPCDGRSRRCPASAPSMRSDAIGSP